MTSEPKQIEGETASPEKNLEARMTFTEHLGELRTRLVRSAIAVFVGCIVCYIFSERIITIVAGPLMPLQNLEVAETPAPEEGRAPDGEPDGEGEGSETVTLGVKWVVLNPLEPVLVSLKLSAYGGILLSLPYLLYNVCAFVFPGLTVFERRVVRILLYGCSILAACGVMVAYFGVFRLVLPYLMEWTPSFVVSQLRLNETISLLLKGMMGFGLAFQFPMVVLILVYMDLLSPQTLKDYRRVAIVGIFVLGALLTPPDPFSMAMMAAPLVILYEGSIWLSYLVVRRRRKTKEAGEAGSAA